jgi:hypothetical protein
MRCQELDRGVLSGFTRREYDQVALLDRHNMLGQSDRSRAVAIMRFECSGPTGTRYRDAPAVAIFSEMDRGALVIVWMVGYSGAIQKPSSPYGLWYALTRRADRSDGITRPRTVDSIAQTVRNPRHRAGTLRTDVHRASSPPNAGGVPRI